MMGSLALFPSVEAVMHPQHIRNILQVYYQARFTESPIIRELRRHAQVETCTSDPGVHLWRVPRGEVPSTPESHPKHKRPKKYSGPMEAPRSPQLSCEGKRCTVRRSGKLVVVFLLKVGLNRV